MLLAVFVSICFVFGGCQRPEITVFAAASTIQAVTEITHAFQKQHGNEIPIRTHFASTSALGNMILQGVQPDLFLAADADWVPRLHEELGTNSVSIKHRDLLTNNIVLVARAGVELELDDIANLPELFCGQIAIGDPDSVPVGRYAGQWFEDCGIWNRLQDRLVFGADAKHTLALITEGAVDVAVVYESDLRSLTKRALLRKVLACPRKEPIVFKLVRLNSKTGATERNRETANIADQLIDFMCSAQAATIFDKHGFEPILVQQDESAAAGQLGRR